MGQDFDVVDRGRFYDPVGAMRDVVQNHLLQVLSLVAMEPPTGHGVDVISDRKRDVFVAMADADPSRYVRGQYRGYLDVDGVAADSQTETFCALRLEIDNWRWSGIPFLIRAGKSLPVTVTEVRVVFSTTPWLGFVPRDAPRPEANQLVLRIGPKPGARMRMQAKDADGPGLRPVQLDMEFASMGGKGPTPYEVLLEAAMRGQSSHFARQDAVEETWRVVQPLIDSPPPVEPYEPGTWGPASADELTTDYGGWRNPGAMSRKLTRPSEGSRRIPPHDDRDTRRHAGPRLPLRRDDPNALHRCDPGGELRTSGDADRDRSGHVHALAALPALRSHRPDLAEPRPFRALRRSRLSPPLVAPPPDRGARGGPRLRDPR